MQTLLHESEGSQFIKCDRTLESGQACCFLRYFGR